MKIVHIEDFFHPDAGYQINILAKYMSSQGHQVYIVTSELDKIPAVLTNFFGKNNIQERDETFTKNTGVRIIRVPLWARISGRSIYKSSIFKIVDSLCPDVLYIHGNDTYLGIRYTFKLGKLKYPVIFDNHMLDIASKNKFNKLFYWFYRHCVAPKLIKHKSIVIRTVDDNFVLNRLGIPLEQTPVIGFGSDLLRFHPDDAVRRQMREKLGIPQDNIVFIYAGKIDESKGGTFLATGLKDRFITKNNLTFLIIGNCVGECRETVESLFAGSENQILRLPTQAYTDLNQYFQCADVAIFPKQCSLTFYDVQACGLPVIVEDNVINTERVKHKNGICFKSGDINDFRSKIIDFAQMGSNALEQMKQCSVQYIKDNYDYKKMSDKYIELLNATLHRR
jgi:glycosyltransferase involved in cell wall biosynthesis